MARRSNTRRSHPTDPRRWLRLWQQSAQLPLTWWELYLASTQTIGSRLGAITAAGLNPDGRQQRENHRMVTEKGLAGMETLQHLLTPNLAMPLAYWRFWSSLWSTNPATGFAPWKPLWEVSLVSAEQGLALWSGSTRPWHRRATANAKRLGKRAAN